MRVLPVIVMLAGCGRLDFSSVNSTDDAPSLDEENVDALVADDAINSGLCTEGDARIERFGSCYSRFDSPLPYMEAAAACASIGAHLATFTTASESDIVEEMANSTAWIGINDRYFPGTFAWITNETSQFTRWQANQPDPGDEHCGEAAMDGNWNNSECQDPKPYYCERSLATLPCIEGDVRVEFGGHCYFRISGNVMYADAVATCLAASAHPPTITSQAENDAVMTLWQAWSWIALNDHAQLQTFEWDTLEPVVYTNWFPGEPSVDATPEHCGHIWNTGVWNNSTCDYFAETMCERP